MLAAVRFVVVLAGALLAATALALADAPRQESCKAAMNARIQTCADACTARALAAVPHYKDTNNNVKFGCLKSCAIGQVLQMRTCAAGAAAPPSDPAETNR